MNTIYSRVITIIAVLVICASSAQAAFDMTAWPYSRSIEAVGKQAMVKVILPTDISWVTSDFSDIRVIDDQAGEVPYLLTRSVTSSNSTTNAQLIDRSSQSDGTTRFIADVGRSGIVQTSMAFVTSSANFRRQVSIYASDSLISLDDSRWSLITSTGYIFAFTDPYSGYVSGKNSVAIPANASRYFKIVISGGPEGPVSVSGVSLTSDVSVETRSYSEEYPVFIYNNLGKKSTEVTVDLGSTGRLSDEITLYPSDMNYSRRVLIEATDDMYATSSWRYVGQGSISGVSTTVFKGYSNTISYPEQRTRYIRISVVNDDNPPLVLAPKAMIKGSVLSLVFEAKIGKSYRLYYGNRYAQKPNYDIARLSSYIDEGDLLALSIGPEVENSEYVAPTGPVIPFTESHKWLLNGLLVLVVIIIGGVIVAYLWVYMRKHPSIPDQGDGFTGGTGIPTTSEDNPDQQK